ncbi:MAG: hypothetical protein NC930_03205 [Candidatus Omnitrophica bacterium]|nr:hypothetical protein [Candidatus Omnitrophota bacterium]
MNLNRIQYWTFLLTKFLAGQGLAQLINLVTGFLILRFLSLEEYAFYLIANVLLTIGNIGSDMGLSQALITFGSQVKDDSYKLGTIFKTAQKYRRQLYFFMSILVVVLMPLMTGRHHWSLNYVSLCICIVLLSNWFQQGINLRGSVLYIHQDTKGLTYSSGGGAILRLVMVLAVCPAWPYAINVLIINLLGFGMTNAILNGKCRPYMQEVVTPSLEQEAVLKKFIRPLIAHNIFYMFQGQISIFLLSIFGYVASIAQVGALSRLGQILSLILLLNPFFIHPYFARIQDKKTYIEKGLQVILFLSFISALVLISSLAFPQWWLIILGENYKNFTAELPVALVCSLISLFDAVIFTMRIAQGYTRGQSWTIAVGIGIQILFLAGHGVKDTLDGLIFNSLIAASMLIVDAVLFAILLCKWERCRAA